jgi:hypothetical protein
MTKFSIDSSGGRSGAPATSSLPPLQRDGTSCDLYEPGHLIHYQHQADAGESSGLPVRDSLLEGTTVTLILEDGGELVWRHHDAERLRSILELLHGRGVAYPDFHALQVGPYWFNCATPDDQWQDCSMSRRAAAGPSSES